MTPRGGKQAPGFKAKPDYRIVFEPSPRRVKVEFDGRIIADSTAMRLVLEKGHLPVYYFAPDDVDMDVLHASEHHTYCPFKGDASYWSIKIGDRVAENAVWSYQNPYAQAMAIKDHMAFYWKAVDHWYEEDDEIFVHPRDPYKRVDVVASSRPVEVTLGGECVARTKRARFLFETGLPTRYYLPPEDVRMDILTPGKTVTRCPYKGEAVYWSARVAGRLFEDIVWSYPAPIPECPHIKGYMCFFNENVDDILVDGKPAEKVKTKWSKET